MLKHGGLKILIYIHFCWQITEITRRWVSKENYSAGMELVLPDRLLLGSLTTPIQQQNIF
jgi:hypothetical protein